MATHFDAVSDFPLLDIWLEIGSMYYDLVSPVDQPLADLLYVRLNTTCMGRIARSDLQNLHPYTSRSSSSISHVPSPSPASNFTLARNSDTCVSNNEYAA